LQAPEIGISTRYEHVLHAMPGLLILFGSVVAVAFQIAFRAKMHANNFFYFLKIIFDISTSK